jgi:hypothetical protein
MKRGVVVAAMMLITGVAFAGKKPEIKGERVASPATFTLALPETLATRPAWSTTELAEENIDGINITELSIAHDATKGKDQVVLKLTVRALVEPGKDKLVSLQWMFMADGKLAFATDRTIEADEGEYNKGGTKLKVTRAQFEKLFSGSAGPQLQLTIKVIEDT